YGELAGAVVRILGELVQALNAVRRYADDRGAGGIELFLLGGKRVRLEVATRGVRRGVEIHHHRSLFQRLLQGEGEVVAGQAGDGTEVRRRGPGLERGRGRHGEQHAQGCRDQGSHNVLVHSRAPRGWHQQV